VSLHSGVMPTMTAPGVPQATLRPSWLLRQTIFIGLAGGGAGAGAASATGVACGLGEQAQREAQAAVARSKAFRFMPVQ